MNEKSEAKELINHYVRENGLSVDDIYDEERGSWFWTRGDVKIQAMLQTVGEDDEQRNYLRVFSPLVKLPSASVTAFYRKLLELNDVSLGVKLTIEEGGNQVYATYERDLEGIDYNEIVKIISDLELWSEDLTGQLVEQFGCEV